MDDRSAIAWLARRVGFGLGPGELDSLVALGVPSVVDRLVDPDAHGIAAAPDPWRSLDLAGYDIHKSGGPLRQASVEAWLQAMFVTPRPLEEWMRWFWHGHFVSTNGVVKDPRLMVGQLRMLGAEGLGDFRTLLRAVTIDPAMLVYLDGTDSRIGAVNENYGREVLELFALGVGNYSEADVRAGATALTGWHVYRPDGTASFQSRIHDDSPQSYLGRTGVHDLDTVVDAIVGHDACAPFITGKLARAILGPDVDDGLISRLAGDFAASGLQIRPLVRAILEAGLDGASSTMVMAPVPWAVAAARSAGVGPDDLGRALPLGLRDAGQLPMSAPNVGGWPGGRAWLTSSTTLSRVDLAGRIASKAPDADPARQAAAAGDLAALADRLGRPEGFIPATSAALGALHDRGDSGVGVLTAALSSPDLVTG
ncbi:MAG: DUF1800 domain-containing protein [Acidimicrobiales bacterium]